MTNLPPPGLTPDELADIRQLLVRLDDLDNVTVGSFDIFDTDGDLLGRAAPASDGSWTFVPGDEDSG